MMGKKKTMTRARAEALIASTNDPEALRELAVHPNKHVVLKVAYKRLDPQARKNATAIKHFSEWLTRFASGGAA